MLRKSPINTNMATKLYKCRQWADHHGKYICEPSSNFS